MTKLQRVIFSLFAIGCIVYLIALFARGGFRSAGKLANQEIVDEANKQIQSTIVRMNNALTTEGISSNFQNPSLSVHAIEWLGKSFILGETTTWDGMEGRPMLYDGNTSIDFDPDHPDWGLPNLRVSMSNVEIIDALGDKKNSKFSIPIISFRDAKPYKKYKVTQLSNDTRENGKLLEIQLWLTSFNIRVETTFEERPDKLRKEIKNRKVPLQYYESYASLGDSIELDELKKEYDNQRYHNLNLVIKVKLNNDKMYLHEFSEESNIITTNEVPDMGIGAIQCSRLLSSNIEGEDDRMNLARGILHSGTAITFYPEYKPLYSHATKEELIRLHYDEDSQLPLRLEEMKDDIITSETKEMPMQTFWNKPQYFRIHFNQIGTWKKSYWYKFGKQIKTHDFIDATFTMPVFVLGKWEVIMPSGLAEWKPPEPLVLSSGGLGGIFNGIGDLFNIFGKGIFGKFFSTGLLVVAGLFLLFLFFPPFLALFTNFLISMVNSIHTIIKKVSN